MIFVSRHQGNVTTTTQVDTGSGFLFAVVFGIAGWALIRYSLHPLLPGRVLIGGLMILLGLIVVGAPFRMIRRSR